ncbi:MAG: hypothetical protein NTX82_05235 [Candidatus Parcubacteria bacterium]|nr:hypothetical protein [Candidatus Parcubacteria bacterium]
MQPQLSSESNIYRPELKKTRQRLEQYIPPDLAVKFPKADLGRLNPEALALLDEIGQRVKVTDLAADDFWAQALAYNQKYETEEELSAEDEAFLDDLGEKKWQERKNLAKTIKYFFKAEQVLDKLIANNEWEDAKEVVDELLAAGEKNIIPKAIQVLDGLFIAEKWDFAFDVLGKLLAAGEKSIIPMAERLLDDFIANEHWSNASKLAGKLLVAGEKNTIPKVKQILDWFIGEYKLNDASKLLSELSASGEQAEVEQVLDKLIIGSDSYKTIEIVGKLLAAGEKKIIPKAEQFLDGYIASHDWVSVRDLIQQLLAAGEKSIIPKVEQEFDRQIAEGNKSAASYIAYGLLAGGEKSIIPKAKQLLDNFKVNDNVYIFGDLANALLTAGEKSIIPKTKQFLDIIEAKSFRIASKLIGALLATGERNIIPMAEQVLNQLMDSKEKYLVSDLASSLLATGEKSVIPKVKHVVDWLMSRGDWDDAKVLVAQFLKAGENIFGMIDQFIADGHEYDARDLARDLTLEFIKADNMEAAEQTIVMYRGNKFSSEFTDILCNSLAAGEKNMIPKAVHLLDDCIANKEWSEFSKLTGQLFAAEEKSIIPKVEQAIDELIASSDGGDLFWASDLAGRLMVAGEKGIIPKAEHILDQLIIAEKWTTISDYVGIFLTVGKSENANYFKLQKAMLEQTQNNSMEAGFLLKFSAYILADKDSNFKEDIDRARQIYQAIYFFSQKANANQPDSKIIKDIDSWWQENSEQLAEVLALDSTRSEDLIKNLMNQGLPKTEASLKVYGPAMKNVEIVKTIKSLIKADKKQEINGLILGLLLETGSAYESLGLGHKMADIVIKYWQKNGQLNYGELQAELSKGLLNELAVRIGIKTEEIAAQDLGNWDLLKLPHLITNAQMIENKKDKEQLNLYQAILRSCFKNNYQEFLTDIEQEDEIGRDVAKHNDKVRQAFEKSHIDWPTWLGFSQELRFDLVAEKQKDPTIEVLKTLMDRLKEYHIQLQSDKSKDLQALAKALEKDLKALEQGKKGLAAKLKGINSIEDALAIFLASHNKALDYLKKKAELNKNEFKLPAELTESYSHFIEAIQLLLDTQKKPQVSNMARESFTVKKWNRDPRTDFFQGNYTHCCIAVGVKETPPGGGLTTLHPETIQQYLVDLGVQVVEVVGEDNRPIAQTWIFISEDTKGPIMVMDNFEVNSKYGIGKHGNAKIREAVFDFVKDYASKCGIDKIALGRVGTNDILSGGLPSGNIKPINKLGGYLWNETYYLEALNQTSPWIVGEGLSFTKKESKETKELKNGFISVFNINNGQAEEYEYTSEVLGQILSGQSEIANEQDITELEKIEQDKFSQAGLENAISSISDILEGLQNNKGIQMLFRDNSGYLKGYLSSIPAVEALRSFEALGLPREYFRPDENDLYIESIAGRIGQENYLKVLSLLKEQAQKAGYKRLMLHGINPKVNASLKLLGFETKEIIDGWFGGYKAEYMEMEL